MAFVSALRGAIIGALLLGGCATATFPPEMLEGVNQALSLGDLRQAPDAYRNEKVMLGGEILATTPRADDTEVEVLGRPLRRDDRPARTDASDGRFLVLAPQFLDPAVYTKGRRLSVIGTFTGEEERSIGDQRYRYPVIAAEQVRLWPPELPAFAYPVYPYPWYLGPPWWGGAYFGPPFYQPWGPYWW
jgi:outer membrane lipoprotein